MKRINYFFARKEFASPEVKQPFYEYRGYFFINSDGKKNYPVSVHFGRNEFAICFKDDTSGKIYKVFSLYIADGELNQKKLSSQIENYWKMPVWPLNRNIEDIKGAAAVLFLETGALCKYMSVDITNDNRFSETSLFKRKDDSNEYEISADRNEINFFYKKNSKKTVTEKWRILKDGISTNKINFKKISLDFLFEIKFANTFEDKNFFPLQQVLQDNRTLDALTRKLCYLIELARLKDDQQESSSPELPLKFKNVEKEWLNICFLEDFKEVFESRNSLFKSPEEEAELVLFKTRIGNARRARSNLFIKNDVRLRNQAASFFLRRYSIYNAFKTLLPTAFVWFIPVLLLLIPLGDFCLSKMPWHVAQNCVGASSIGIPVLIITALIIHYLITDINLFKLLLPRMFLGIMLGWSVFWGGEEFWKAAVMASAPKIFITDTVLFILIFLYIFTDIQNKLFREKTRIIIGRTTVLILFAILISFVQGFYVLQFQAKPMLENSGFLNNPKICSTKTQKDDIKTRLECNNKQKKRELFGIKNFSTAPTFIKYFFKGANLYYIWSIHFSQLMMSILIGIVLQLLWEDRPITEPL